MHVKILLLPGCQLICPHAHSRLNAAVRQHPARRKEKARQAGGSCLHMADSHNLAPFHTIHHALYAGRQRCMPACAAIHWSHALHMSFAGQLRPAQGRRDIEFPAVIVLLRLGCNILIPRTLQQHDCMPSSLALNTVTTSP